MSFDKKKFIDIYNSMENDARERIPELTDFQEGSLLRSLFESFAVELGILYEQMNIVYESAFIDTANSINLDRVVSILGIKRNEPDYATGVVTFEREQGLQNSIIVPAGTILTTEEDTVQNITRKVYITIEEGKIEKNETSVDVRIIAQERGKEMKSGSDTVIVMPRPVPGIKSVTNNKPVRFLGKDGETDEELRNRAKQILLASGRANIASIENALYTFPGIREVRVNEIFEVYKITDDAILNMRKQLELNKTDPFEIEDFINILDSIRNTEFITEEEFSSYVSQKIQDQGYDKYLPDILVNSRVLNPGIIDVYVDGLTADNSVEVRNCIDQVRAAGVYVRIKPAIPVNLIGSFKIDIVEQVTGEDMEQLEKDVRDVIIDFIDSHKLGEPLIFSQLTRKILNVNGITDLEEFNITAYRELEQFAQGEININRSNTDVVQLEGIITFSTSTGYRYRVLNGIDFAQNETQKTVTVTALKSGEDGELHRTGIAVEWEKYEFGGDIYCVENDEPILLPRNEYLVQDKRIEVKLLERFMPEKIMVAKGIKDRLVRIYIRLVEINTLDDNEIKARADTIVEKVNTYFEVFEAKRSAGEVNFFTETDIKKTAEKVDKINLVEASLFELPYQDDVYRNVFKIEPGIVEKAVVESVFVYKNRLELEGEISLIFSLTASGNEKLQSKAGVRQTLKDYLESLKPEEDITFDQIRNLAGEGEGVLRVEMDYRKFRLVMPGDETKDYSDRIDNEKIKIESLEKLYLADERFIIKI